MIKRMIGIVATLAVLALLVLVVLRRNDFHSAFFGEREIDSMPETPQQIVEPATQFALPEPEPQNVSDSLTALQ